MAKDPEPEPTTEPIVVPWVDKDEDIETFLRRAQCQHGKLLLENCEQCNAEVAAEFNR